MVKDGYLNKFYVFSSYILSRIKSFQVFTNAKAKEELNQTRKRKMESESKLSGNKDKIKKAEVKLFEIKTYREYEALQKEIGDVKKANADLEEEILKEMETLEGLETEVKEKENTLNEKEKEYDKIVDI